MSKKRTRRSCSKEFKQDACGHDASTDELEAENKRFRNQLKDAEMEREILKKATAYFG